MQSVLQQDPTLLLSLLLHIIAFKVQCSDVFCTLPQAGKGDTPQGWYEVYYMTVYLCSSQCHHFLAHQAAAHHVAGSGPVSQDMCQMVFP